MSSGAGNGAVNPAMILPWATAYFACALGQMEGSTSHLPVTLGPILSLRPKEEDAHSHCLCLGVC